MFKTIPAHIDKNIKGNTSFNIWPDKYADKHPTHREIKYTTLFKYKYSLIFIIIFTTAIKIIKIYGKINKSIPTIPKASNCVSKSLSGQTNELDLVKEIPHI